MDTNEYVLFLVITLISILISLSFFPVIFALALLIRFFTKINNLTKILVFLYIVITSLLILFIESKSHGDYTDFETGIYSPPTTASITLLILFYILLIMSPFLFNKFIKK